MEENIIEKLAIVRKICKLHPGYGTEKKWSWYTGGMTDTGNWYWEKMLDEVPIEELKSFIDKIEEDELKSKLEQERWNKLSPEEQKLEREENWKKEEHSLIEWMLKEELDLMWGKPIIWTSKPE